jgi:hypothetical protein
MSVLDSVGSDDDVDPWVGSNGEEGGWEPKPQHRHLMAWGRLAGAGWFGDSLFYHLEQRHTAFWFFGSRC